MSARVKLPKPLDTLLRSQMEKAIYEAALHRDDELIARRRIIDNQNANARAVLDALNQNYIRALENENQSLKLSASQSNQNAVLMAAMDANKAEILRRTGAECPTPAYWVQPPTPVQVPCNPCSNC